jgi:hypothetical protein
MLIHKSPILLAAVALALCAVGCEKEGENPSAPAPKPASSAAVTGAEIPADPLANVENKGQVKRYPDETKITPSKQAQLIDGFSVDMRESPRGDVLTTTMVTQTVTEVARDARGDYYLVTYDDPKNAGKQLAGWVYKDALENTAWSTGAAGGPSGAARSAKLACGHGEAHLRTAKDFCAKTCKDDTNCDKRAGEICDGLGFLVPEGGGKVTNVNFCISSWSPTANSDHSSQHGSSVPLEQMSKPGK